ncbi:WD repeat-containing protein 97-like isoform X2 [Prorops nasuta]|uniref:WD repeat-containing protein 97-like isoform X2 n=1 Tax=Prorops nasuta TaxID=863751 RepID=UPI0034CE1561
MFSLEEKRFRGFRGMFLARVDCENSLNDEANRERWGFLVEKMQERLKSREKIMEDNGSSRLVISYQTTLYVTSLEPDKDKGETVPLEFLSKQVMAMKYPISALCYCRVSSWIVTGDLKGNVIGWNLNLSPMMTCAKAHAGKILDIFDHPCTSGFVTTAEDRVLQVWSCNLREKVETFDDLGEIFCGSLNSSAAAIATVGDKLCCFNMCQLYSFYAPLTSPVKFLLSTDNPMYPRKLVAGSNDNIVRVFSAVSGDPLNAQILPSALEIVNVAYSDAESSIYTILSRTGEILVSNTSTNPMKYEHVWINDDSLATCIIVYEHYEEIRGTNKNNKRELYHIRTFVIIGTDNGNIVIMNLSTGEHRDIFPAHKGPVKMLHSSSSSRKVISMGEDKQVKIWTIFPDIQAPLALAYALYFSVPVMHVSTMGSILCVVNESTPKFYPLVMYNMHNQEKMVHHYSKDHQKLVTDITASDSLLICSTSSLDKTICLWDQNNSLIRILEINCCPLKITFSSLDGDIVFCAGKHLYKIPSENYLPSTYRNLAMTSSDSMEVEESALPEDVDYRVYEEECELENILHVTSSTPFGTLAPGATDVPSMAAAMKKFACAQFQFRDDDIDRLINGIINARKLVPDKALMTRKDWENYLKEISPKKEDIDTYNIFEFIMKFADISKVYCKPKIKKTEDDNEDYTSTPNFGLLPNSVIYKIYIEEPKLKSVGKVRRPAIKYKYPKDILDLSKKRESMGGYLIAPELLELQAAAEGM